MSGEIALPRGYSLNEYRIESTLGIGGFGLTYLATDVNLNLKVALKEYLPSAFALRCDDQSVQPNSDSARETFKWGLKRFLDESRTLASFRHSNIVRVMRFFEANETAYMVMEFVSGEPLTSWVGVRRPLPESSLIGIVHPLLDGLEVIHRGGYLHRDIKPANIFMRDDGSPVLIDFGSARDASVNTEMTAIVTPGYAPFEQYHSQGNQGPWTDLYSFGAVLYWVVTGERPLEAPARVRKDVMRPATRAVEGSRYSAELLKAIDWMLTPDEDGRPQSVADFRKALPRVAALPISEQPTVVVAQPPEPGPVSVGTRFATTPVFDSGTLKQITNDLAAHIGPIASVMVKAAAKKAASLAQLAGQLGAEIADEKQRDAFVRKYSAPERSLPAAEASAPTAHLPSSQVPSATQRFDPALLANAEAALGKYIGAIARVVVKRAAAKARDESEFYLLLADHIEDKDERKSFIRKAVSASGNA